MDVDFFLHRFFVLFCYNFWNFIFYVVLQSKSETNRRSNLIIKKVFIHLFERKKCDKVICWCDEIWWMMSVFSCVVCVCACAAVNWDSNRIQLKTFAIRNWGKIFWRRHNRFNNFINEIGRFCLTTCEFLMKMGFVKSNSLVCQLECTADFYSIKLSGFFFDTFEKQNRFSSSYLNKTLKANNHWHLLENAFSLLLKFVLFASAILLQIYRYCWRIFSFYQIWTLFNRSNIHRSFLFLCK